MRNPPYNPENHGGIVPKDYIYTAPSESCDVHNQENTIDDWLDDLLEDNDDEDNNEDTDLPPDDIDDTQNNEGNEGNNQNGNNGNNGNGNGN